jgi:ubiquinone/menaquinone biosynthesis C-methylase UbiE
MKKDTFDNYADQYSRVITEGARSSGETYEYMVELRTRLFKEITNHELKEISHPSLLDFGCGTGYTIERLSVRFPNAVLYGFDASSESVGQAINRTVARAHFTHSKNCPLPYEDNSFHAIYSNGTFHHINPLERPLWMKELFRVLKRKGVLVVFENNPLNPLMMQAMKRTPFDRDACPIRAGKLAAIMNDAGLQTYIPRYYFFFPHLLRWFRFTEPLLGFFPFGAQYFVKSIKG